MSPLDAELLAQVDARDVWLRKVMEQKIKFKAASTPLPGYEGCKHLARFSSWITLSANYHNKLETSGSKQLNKTALLGHIWFPHFLPKGQKVRQSGHPSGSRVLLQLTQSPFTLDIQRPKDATKRAPFPICPCPGCPTLCQMWSNTFRMDGTIKQSFQTKNASILLQLTSATWQLISSLHTLISSWQ